MFYVKAKLGYCEIKIEINDENVFNTCPVCGNETQVSLEETLRNNDCDLYSTNVLCDECSANHIKSIRSEAEE